MVAPPKDTADGPYSYCKEADNVVDMDQWFDTIYVYTDVVKSRIVGDSLALLLQSLLVGGSHGATVYDRFTNIHYVPLLYAQFKSIEINIREDTGRFMPFEYGKVTVTLHVDCAGPDCSEDELHRVLCASGGWCTALLRRCPIPARSRTRQFVRRSAAQGHATHQERCRGVEKGGVEDRRAHSRQRHVRTEHKKATKRASQMLVGV